MDQYPKPSTESAPLVSAIIPCYNVADHISHALDSLKTQTHSNLEVICVDDGSTDDTLAYIEKWKTGNTSIKLTVLQQKNSGACSARNTGLKHATGSFVQFLDADDLLLPEKIERQLHLLQSDAKAGFVAGSYSRCNVKGECKRVPIKGVGLPEVYFGMAGITSANFFRTSSVEKAGGWNVELQSSQEADLMFRILLNGEKGIVDDAFLTEIRDRESGQISKSDPMQRIRNYLAVRTAMIDGIREYHPHEWEKYRKELQSFMVSTLLVLNRYQSDAWRDYAEYLPYKSELVQLAGLSKKNIRLIRLMGYTNYFMLASRLKPTKI